MISAASHVDRIACIKIVLDHVEPAIWRRVEVPLTTSLRGLHEVIQAVMLFENYHLFDFTIEIDGQSRRYGIPDPDGWIKLSDAKNTKLGPLTNRGLKRFAYTYDFGDNWEHTLTIEATGDADPGLDYPRFVDGARRAPPEDVGGIPGFEEFVEAMAKPRHPERKRLIEWYGRVFDPEDIDLPTIKANIAKLTRRRAIGKAAFAKSRLSER
ncbi:hypothetical protein ABIE41_000148 [Bosea sp. OAE506]|uniref:plasmid pRiA4b ORF-3 family protein n=1 Tax=Bosea sp. OAE506 TaxID=2663870 RepID=UPI001789FC65